MTDIPLRPCPKCGRPWRPWANSKLSCHAKCYFETAVQDDIYQLKLQFPRVSMYRLAKDFKVPLQVIHASLAEAARRAGKIIPRVSGR